MAFEKSRISLLRELMKFWDTIPEPTRSEAIGMFCNSIKLAMDTASADCIDLEKVFKKITTNHSEAAIQVCRDTCELCAEYGAREK